VYPFLAARVLANPNGLQVRRTGDDQGRAQEVAPPIEGNERKGEGRPWGTFPVTRICAFNAVQKESRMYKGVCCAYPMHSEQNRTKDPSDQVKQVKGEEEGWRTPQGLALTKMASVPTPAARMGPSVRNTRSFLWVFPKC